MKLVKWNKIKWAPAQVEILNLQYKIYKHAKSGNTYKVHHYQRKLVNKFDAKLLAVRIVTQDNRGKRTTGVDGISELTPFQRINLAQRLVLDGKSSKIRRIFIPKANGKLRPLGIPTIEDRVKQCLLRMALEPEWEARFEPNSYGFRPGYSTSDAKWAIARQLQGSPKYFLDADIKGCFDNIDHDYLINKLKTLKMFKSQIRSWLKAGILAEMPEESLETNEAGTPQGGVISPLLMNIALHGMENEILMTLNKRSEIKVIRYAGDFVIFGRKLESVLKAREVVSRFLKPIGLELSKEKTRVGHSMAKKPGTEGPPGLDFLGYHFRNISCSRHRGVKSTQGKTQPFKLVTHPSRDAVKRHKSNLRYVLAKFKNAPLGKVVERLSSTIRGWTWYHSVTQCHHTFSNVDAWLWKRLWRWAGKRYKGRKNAKLKCFNVQGWEFGYIENGKSYILNRHDQTKVRKYVKIKANASIYDVNLVLYFAGRVPLTHPRSRNLLSIFKKQNYACPICKQPFGSSDVIELHHVIDEKGKRTRKLQFLHGHCHDRVHDNNSSNS